MFKQCLITCQIASSVLSTKGFKVKSIIDREYATVIYGNKNFLPSPDIQVTKLNPTKYLYRVSQTPSSFFIHLSESFDSDWKLYFFPHQQFQDKNSSFLSSWENPLSTFGAHQLDISILKRDCEGVKCEESGHLELNAFLINSSLPATLRNWLNLNPLVEWPERFHWNFNGFSNVWYIDRNFLKDLNDKTGSQYLKESDGTINMNIVVEYSPQKLHFIGLAGSLITIGFIFIFFLLSGIKKLKNNFKYL